MKTGEMRKMTFKLKNKPIHWKRISQPYKPKTHRGIDLAAPTGTPVYATADGRVVAASRGAWHWSYGNMVAIYHGGGVYTNHAHLSKIKVRIGQKVKAGRLIGLCGSTGRSTGPHLHFEIHLGKWNRVDPKPYLDDLATRSKSYYHAEKTYETQEKMNVREKASSKSHKVGTLDKGKKVHVIAVHKTKNGTYWLKFIYRGKARWICARTSKGKVYIK